MTNQPDETDMMVEGLRQMAARLERGTPLAEVLAAYSELNRNPAWMQMEAVEAPELEPRFCGALEQ